MKEVMRYGTLLGIGLMVAIIFYPLTHELGHVLIAVIVGADVIEIEIFPIPSILCDLKGVGNFEAALIGLGGLISPFLLTVCFEPRKFGLWYICFTMRWISLLAFVIGFVSVICFVLGKPIANDDLTQVLEFAPYMAPLCVSLCVILMAIDVVLIFKSKPFQRCEELMK